MLLPATWKNYLRVMTLFLIFSPAACMRSSSTIPQSPPPSALSKQTSTYQPSESNKPWRPVFYVWQESIKLFACPGVDCPVVAALQKNEELQLLQETDIISSTPADHEWIAGVRYSYIIPPWVERRPYYWYFVRIKRDGRTGFVDSLGLLKEKRD